MKGVSLGLKFTPTTSAAAGYETLHLPQVWYPPIPHPNEEDPQGHPEQSTPEGGRGARPGLQAAIHVTQAEIYLWKKTQIVPSEKYQIHSTTLSGISYPHFFSSLLKCHAQKSSHSGGSNASQTSTASLCVPCKGRRARVPSRGFPGGSGAKSLSAMQEVWVRSPAQEDLEQKKMAIHSSILAWRIPWTDEAGGLQSRGSQSLSRP